MVLHAIYYVIILPKMKKKSGKSIIKFLIIKHGTNKDSNI